MCKGQEVDPSCASSVLWSSEVDSPSQDRRPTDKWGLVHKTRAYRIAPCKMSWSTSHLKTASHDAAQSHGCVIHTVNINMCGGNVFTIIAGTITLQKYSLQNVHVAVVTLHLAHMEFIDRQAETKRYRHSIGWRRYWGRFYVIHTVAPCVTRQNSCQYSSASGNWHSRRLKQ